METTSPRVRIAAIYWIASVLFVLLFVAYFPLMIGLGLRSPIFWAAFALLGACATLHGRITKEQSAIVRHGLRLPAFLCLAICVWGIICAVVLANIHGVDPARQVFYKQWIIPAFLAGFCATCALVSSFKQDSR